MTVTHMIKAAPAMITMTTNAVTVITENTVYDLTADVVESF